MRSVALAAAIALTVTLAVALPAGAAGDWPWPVAGPVLTPFDNGDDPYAAGRHRGVDIGAPEGEAVVSATPGTVTFAGLAGSSGQTVGVRSADGRHEVSYLHLSAIAVRAGQPVAPGERIGAVGVTGRRSAEAPHLHFGVREADTDHAYLDPLAFLSERVGVAPPPDVAPVAPVVSTPPAGALSETPSRPQGAAVRPPRPSAATPRAARRPLPASAPTPLAASQPAPVARSGARSASSSTAGAGATKAATTAAPRNGSRGARAVEASARTRLGSGPRGRDAAGGRGKAPAPSATGAVPPPSAAAPPMTLEPPPASGASAGWWALCLVIALAGLLGHGLRGRRAASAEALPTPRGEDPARAELAPHPSGPRPHATASVRGVARRRPGRVRAPARRMGSSPGPAPRVSGAGAEANDRPS